MIYDKTINFDNIILTTKEGPTLSLQQNINNDWLAVNK